MREEGKREKEELKGHGKERIGKLREEEKKGNGELKGDGKKRKGKTARGKEME